MGLNSEQFPQKHLTLKRFYETICCVLAAWRVIYRRPGLRRGSSTRVIAVPREDQMKWGAFEERLLKMTQWDLRE